MTGAAPNDTADNTDPENAELGPEVAQSGVDAAASEAAEQSYEDDTFGATLNTDHEATLEDGTTTTLAAGTFVVVVNAEAGEIHTEHGQATVEALDADVQEDASDFYRRNDTLYELPGGGEALAELSAADDVVELDRYGRYSKVAANTEIGWVDTKYIGDGWAPNNHQQRAVTVPEDTPAYGTPSTEGGVAGTLSPGESYAVTKSNEAGDWLRVHLDHGWAWVPDEAVTDADVEQVEVDDLVEVAEEGREIVTLHPTQSYPVIEEEDGSYLVNTEGSVAWYTPEEEPEEPETPSPEPTEGAPTPDDPPSAEPEPEPSPSESSTAEPEPEPEKPDPTPEPAEPKGSLYTTADVNMRTGPGTDHDAVSVIPANTKLPYYETRNGWAHVSSDQGEGWISLSYLSKKQQYPFAVYGTLRTGQSADFVIDPLTESTEEVNITEHQLWQHPSELWWTFIVPGDGEVVAERKTITKDSYSQAISTIDEWERYDPNAPKEDQIYNRELVKDDQGRDAWGYVAGEKQQQYITNAGTLIPSGDYTRR